jgi:hypothetical protein
MGKWINPEIALGFLLASMFWACVLGWQAAYAPTERIKNECYEAAQKSGHKTEECKSLWERTTSDPVALFTFVLSVSTIGLWAVTWRSGVRQTRDMEGAIAAAQDANKISNTHMIADQRAWVAVGHLGIIDDIVFKAAEGGAVVFLSVTLTNLGKTPALDVHTQMDMAFDDDSARQRLREIAVSERASESRWTRILLPNDSYQREWALAIDTPTTGVHVSPRVIGCVTYRIVPDNTIHQTGFDFVLFEQHPNGRFRDLLRADTPVISKETVGYSGGPGAFAD